jgi:hypothetical protein
MDYTVDLRVLGKQRYQLLNSISYIDDNWIITVMKGFMYDGASIPRSLWDNIGCPIDYAYASAIHDGLYRSRLLGRKDCDKIFYNALLQSGEHKTTALSMYLAVRAGGQQAYDDARHMMAHYRNYIVIIPK